jgi:hypothetical protein
MIKQFEVVGNFFPKVKSYCNHDSAKSCVKDMLKADKKGKIVINFLEKAVTSAHIGNEKVAELVKKLIEQIEQNKKGKISQKVTHKAKELKKQFKEKVKDLTKATKAEKAKKTEKVEKKPEKSGKDEKEEVSVKKQENERPAQPKKTAVEEAEELLAKFSYDIVGIIGSFLVEDILKEVKGNLNDPKIAELKPWIKQIGHNLDAIDLTDSEVTNDQLTDLVTFFPNLQRVHIQIPKANDQTLEILSRLNNLNDLEIPNKHYDESSFTAAGLKHLQKLSGLEHLSLGWCSSATSDAIGSMEPLTKLKSFQIQADLRNDALKAIGKFSELKNLSLGYCIHISDEGITLLGDLKKLESIEIKNAGNFTNESLKTIGQLTSLKLVKLHLDVAGEGVTGEAFTHLAHLAEIHTLEIGGTFQDDDLQHLGSLKNLHTLTLCSYEIEGKGIKHLASLTNLRHITLQGNSWQNNRYNGDTVCRELAKLKQLETVRYVNRNAPHNKITDKGFEALTALQELETLEVDSSSKCTEKAFQSLAKLEKLTNLTLALSYLKEKEAEKGLLHLPKLKMLTSLTFEHLIGDVLIEVISKISTLEKLSLGVDHSDSDISALTDNGIKHIVHLSKLKELALNNCDHITKKSIEQFAKLSLSKLRITGTYIKEKAFNILKNKGVQVDTVF